MELAEINEIEVEKRRKLENEMKSNAVARSQATQAELGPCLEARSTREANTPVLLEQQRPK